MTLILSVLTGPDEAVAEKRVSPGSPFSLGRAPDNDWMLADPQRHLSKRHCTITFRDTFWEVTDLSTNGTFLNGEREPIGHGAVRDLRDGDRLRLGGSEIAIPMAQALQEAAFSDVDPFEGPPQPDHSPGIEDAFNPPRPVVVLGEDWDLGDSAAPLPVQAIAPAFTPVAAPAPEPSDLMAAFLRGAGLRDANPADPVAAMEALGEAFRAFAHGLRLTTTHPEAMASSTTEGMGEAEAVSEAFRDIRLHELATMSAMQTAVRGMLRELAPEKLREGGGPSLLASQRKVRAWEAFEAAHARMTQALSDNFDSTFGRAFARAYEQAMRETKQ